MSGSGIGRRSFLRVLGATGVAAGCSPAHAPEKLIPLLNPPENMVPGKPLYYRTVCRECAAGCGVTARSREGRVVKLEGNPEEPISAGALCARGQAAVQTLYAPDRFRGPMVRASDGTLAPVSWPTALGRVAEAIKAAPPTRVRLVTRSEPGSTGFIHRAFMTALGAAPELRVVVEARDYSGLREASRLLYGRAELPAYDLAAAHAVAAFGADFAETWLSPVELARGFAAGRGGAGPQRTSLAWVGPRLGATGAGADVWIDCRPGTEADVALLLLGWIVDPVNRVSDLAAESAAVRSALTTLNLREAAQRAGVSAEQVATLGNLVSSRHPSALLGSDADTAPLLLLANHLLGNVGRTVLLGQDALLDPPSPAAALTTLFDDARAGRVDVLLLHHAALPYPDALARVPMIVSFASRADASTELAHLVLPDLHWLESFGDIETRKGVLALSQPAMTPLYENRSASDVLLDIGKRLGLGARGLPPGNFQTISRKRAVARAAELGTAAAGHERDLFMRGVAVKPAPHESRTFSSGAIASLLGSPPKRPPSPGDGFVLFAFPTALAHGDPRAPSWLREVPDAVSRVCWSSWIELNPADAARIGAKDGDLVAVTAAGGEARLPLCTYVGLREGTAAVPASAPEVRKLQGALSLRRIGSGVLPRIPGAQDDVGRELVPAAAAVVSREEHQHGHEHGHDRGIGYEHPPEEHPYGMRPPPSHPTHRWAMAIDLDRCTGCQACVVACYAENNVAVTGPEAALRGRNLAWLRIQRSITGTGRDVDVKFLPSLCQQCDRAPCEPVCPVYATYHTSEGLNAMVYNRCIGTRYCSNNCPYDARVFNWRDPVFEKPLDLQLNPDVTVRSKGVMEKCTFCVQRIRFVENEAKTERRNVLDGEVVPACAQTCPSHAIVFGDVEDPGSRISRVRQDPRAYRLLEDLATGPAVTYLARGGSR
ncbi:MAG TPA: molybdopterin dinucleotide binding domain-containing protein [Myxococcales bacterium]|nr:molybdopterin dinucleotide binding domain-containing protein [Myxococcales bacterium]